VPDKDFQPIGLVWLIHKLGLKLPLPDTRSELTAGIRRTIVHPHSVIEQYPRSYAPANLIGHLRFALRYEPLDIRVWHAILNVLPARELNRWIRQDPTSRFARRAWYLYETLTGDTLNFPDVPPTAYVDLADRKLQFTGPLKRARRQRINVNWIGDETYGVLIRRTPQLIESARLDPGARARKLTEGCDPGLLARAVHYLFTKETKSSFAIEGESPSETRSERFVAALERAAGFDPASQPDLLRLQNLIVDPRYVEHGWRKSQNWVGQTRSDFSETVHFVCPKPGDVGPLMEGWMRMAAQLDSDDLDPVAAAAAVAFGFVFIHPFEDGNGRIHRFLIHHVLSRRGFTPEGLLFPVSAAMLRERRAYDAVLERFSRSIMPFIRYRLEGERMRVSSETRELYQFWDATPFAEYLYATIEETIRRDLTEELAFLRKFDEAVRRTMDIVDMPDRRASLLVRLILQNEGTLSRTKRSQFRELTQKEIAAIERAVRSA
jgi:Fic family protein